MRYLFFLLLLPIAVASAQTDMVPARGSIRAINLTDNPFTPASAVDSIDFIEIPAGTMILRAYSLIDTATTQTDSIQIRLGKAQVLLHTFLPGSETAGAMAFTMIEYPARISDMIRLIYYGTASAPSGQVKFAVVYEVMQ